MLPFFKGKESLRETPNFQWGSELLWDVRMPDAPHPFDTWFPASSVEENLYTLELKGFEFYNNTFSVPERTSEFDLKITFFDDVPRTILTWIRNWVNNEILNEGKLITPIKHAAKELLLVKSDYQLNELSRAHYWVIPNGAGHYTGGSSPNAATSEIDFIIVGGG